MAARAHTTRAHPPAGGRARDRTRRSVPRPGRSAVPPSRPALTVLVPPRRGARALPRRAAVVVAARLAHARSGARRRDDGQRADRLGRARARGARDRRASPSAPRRSLLSVAGLAFMLADRPSRLPLGAALDGMTGALVAQAVIAAILFSPVKGALQDGFDVVVLLYPLADVLLMGLVAAARRPRRLAPGLLGREPRRARGDHDRRLERAGHVDRRRRTSRAAPPTSAGWPGPGSSRSPPGARSRSARPTSGSAAPCPSVLGTVALGIVVITAFSPDPLIPTLACASGALAVVVGRLAITLHDNNLMLSVARTDSVTDALTGLGNRRQLMADLEDELDHATETSPAALALFDLNGFKDYNDTLRPPRRRRAPRGARHRPRRRPSRGSAPRTGWAATSSACSCTPARPTTTRSPSAPPRRSRPPLAGSPSPPPTASCCSPARPPRRATRCAAPTSACTRTSPASRVGSRRQVTQALMLAIEERDRALHGHGDGRRRSSRPASPGGSGSATTERRRGPPRRAAPRRRQARDPRPHPREARPARRRTSGSSCAATRSSASGSSRARPALRDVAGLVRASHEHFDGNGYPDGLRGEDIPVGARIIAVCDAFDAMTRDRVLSARRRLRRPRSRSCAAARARSSIRRWSRRSPTRTRRPPPCTPAGSRPRGGVARGCPGGRPRP